ncbi:hypothetical protein NPIL_557691 [Nephila pilipes]|uniref:Uncharacterized protein n=1 Tax=Nephila pilipes TaxID=299642 RepID=A0A8X6P5C9_NEPPI|nr:hypothetical protein NPIL_557691 [Nephila pilipes]
MESDVTRQLLLGRKKFALFKINTEQATEQYRSSLVTKKESEMKKAVKPHGQYDVVRVGNHEDPNPTSSTAVLLVYRLQLNSSEAL